MKAFFWAGLFSGEFCPYMDHFVVIIVQYKKLTLQLSFTSLLHGQLLCTWPITTEPGNRKCNFRMIIIVPDSFPM